MMSPCKTCDVSHVYLGLGYTPRVKGLCMYVLHSIHSTEEQVLRSLVPPTPQILKTGSVDSWLPSFPHGGDTTQFKRIIPVYSAMLRGRVFK